MALKTVLTPVEIGPITVKNRVARTGHGTGLGGGTMNDTLIGYHVARAKGGVGLTILELCSVSRSAYPYLRDDGADLVAGYRKLMAQVEPYGMKVFQQIGHLGNEVPQADGSPPWSSSDTIGAGVGVQAEPMSKAKIEEFKQAYVDIAKKCTEGGLDGIELHMAHGYMVQQFLSPLYNRREDEYGGPFENRIRLALELLTAVRDTVPSSMAVGVRLSSEVLPGGMGPDEVARVARVFEEKNLIDYLNLSLGTDYNSHRIIGAMHEPTGYELPFDVPVKHQMQRVPVLVTGRFRTLEEVDQVLRQGDADLVAMNRAHIADPDIVQKTIEGRVDEIRPCIGCNHGCVGGLGTVGRMSCTVNVAVGAEDSLSDELIEKTANPKTVLVVGGGPAGLEAARVAALRGHKVILAEANSELGGSINVAKRAPRRIGIGDITDWLEREVYRLGVEVRLSTYIQAEDVAEIAPDAVIVATGSLPRMDGAQYLTPGFSSAGMERKHVVSSHDLLLENTNRDWGKRAVVFDDVGHYEGVAAAEFLVEKGVGVTFVTSQKSFAPGLEPSLSSMPALERLAKGDFELVTYGKLVSIGDEQVEVEHRYGGQPMNFDADTVVFVSHNACNNELLAELEGFNGPVIPVGDVRSPRYLQTAIREGNMAARSIG